MNTHRSRNYRPAAAGLLVFLLLFIIAATPALSQETAVKSPFTTDDALTLKSFRMQSVTDDGRYIAGVISCRRDRLNVDHKRYGDPTYIAPSLGVPVIIDTETRETQTLFTDKVQARSFAWSPDGKTLAFFLRKGDRYFLNTYDRDRKRVNEIALKTDKPVASNSPLRWTPDGSGILLALRDSGWVERARAAFREATVGPITIYDSKKPFLKWDEVRGLSALQIPALVELKSRKVTELLPEGRYGNIRQSHDGKFMTYVRNYPEKTVYTRSGGTEYELFMLDMQAPGEPKSLRKRTSRRLNLTWNENNDTFAYAEKGDIFVQSVFDEEPRNLTKDKVKPAEGDTAKVRFSMMRWSPGGSQLLASTKKGYWLIDPRSGGLEMVYALPEDPETTPAMRVSGWSPDGRNLYMTYAAKVMRYDLESRRMTELVKDSNLYGGWTMAKNGEKFFYTFSDGDMPNDLYMTDKMFRTKTRLTDLNPWIRDKKISKTELVKYLDADGNELYGVLYYPVDYKPGKKYPLVCEIYETYFNNGFNTNMNLITNAGFFGFHPSVKLETGYPGEAWIKGVTAGINTLIDRGLVNPKKLGVQGQSYGGYAVSLIVAQTNRFAAAVNISGKVDIISFLGDSPRIGTRNYSAAERGQDRIGKTFWEAPLKYIMHSAVFFADRIETPLLLLTGEGDWNVPATNTREMYYAMRRLGKEVVWVNYYNGGHGAGRASNAADFSDHWNRIISWYQTHFDKVDEKEKKKKE